MGRCRVSSCGGGAREGCGAVFEALRLNRCLRHAPFGEASGRGLSRRCGCSGAEAEAEGMGWGEERRALWGKRAGEGEGEGEDVEDVEDEDEDVEDEEVDDDEDEMEDVEEEDDDIETSSEEELKEGVSNMPRNPLAPEALTNMEGESEESCSKERKLRLSMDCRRCSMWVAVSQTRPMRLRRAEERHSKLCSEGKVATSCARIRT